MDPHSDEFGVIEVARMKSYFQSLTSPMMLLLVVLTFGVGLLIILLIRTSFAQRIWIQDGRLHATKGLPDEGVPIGELHLQEVRQRLLFFTLNRFLMIRYTDERDRVQQIAINQVHHGKDSIERALQLL